MKLYPESEKSTFAYWFAHWRAFNLTAMLLGVWHPRFLFHDIEKPFLMFIWRDYPRVKEFHRTHARHHWKYKGKRGYDYLGMVIDWECSRFSKSAAPLNAYETWCNDLVQQKEHTDELINKIYPILQELHLDNVRQLNYNVNEHPNS